MHTANSTATKQQNPLHNSEEAQLKCKTFKDIFKNISSYETHHFANFNNFTKWLHRPVDGAALGVFRLLYGAIMLIDLAEERGGGQLDIRFGEPYKCHFPLFNFIKTFSYPIMGCIYIIMWLGAFGIAVGYNFRLSCLAYTVSYWYIFLLDKPSWNNHSYLFGLVGILLCFTQANHYCALDKWLNPSLNQTIPYWNYFLIKFQFFILYVYAGVKKFSFEWLAGYSMSSLSHHWVLWPFRWFLSYEMVDLLIVHWLTAIFDFSIAFFMTCQRTRVWATPFMILFHLMNSRLFVIGMFPWVCLAEIPLFYSCTWPRHLRMKNMWNFVTKKQFSYAADKTCCALAKADPSVSGDHNVATKENHLRTWIILSYCFMQLFVPYSHFMTPGYNNWTNGLYGYSWDMMVHSFETLEAQIKITDNANKKEHYLEPYAFTEYDRWTKYADMAQQYAQCIYRNLRTMYHQKSSLVPLTSLNLSIYFDVWCSMNGRLMQRVFDPRVDLLQADWSPFRKTLWSLPLLDDFKDMRPKLLSISNEVYRWNNATDVIFVADYPGLTLENLIPSDIINTSLTILEGNVRYQEMDEKEVFYLTAGKSIAVATRLGYRVMTVGLSPSIYMITYTNQTMLEQHINLEENDKRMKNEKPWLPLAKELQERFNNYKTFVQHMINCVLFLLYGVPIPLHKLHPNYLTN